MGNFSTAARGRNGRLQDARYGARRDCASVSGRERYETSLEAGPSEPGRLFFRNVPDQRKTVRFLYIATPETLEIALNRGRSLWPNTVHRRKILAYCPAPRAARILSGSLFVVAAWSFRM